MYILLVYTFSFFTTKLIITARQTASHQGNGEGTGGQATVNNNRSSVKYLLI